MASAVTHVIVAGTLGLGIRPSPTPPRFWLLGALCSVIPDIDVVGFWLGIPYEALLGHRGLTHSLAFAAAWSLLVTSLVAQARPWSGFQVRWLLYCFLCTASHGALDALTNGGRGVAFFAPFDNHRYFFPLRPIEVSPLSLRELFSGRSITILSSEMLWVWVPCLGISALIVLARRRLASTTRSDA